MSATGYLIFGVIYAIFIIAVIGLMRWHGIQQEQAKSDPAEWG